jgi:hypothetical protein
VKAPAFTGRLQGVPNQKTEPGRLQANLCIEQ